MKPKTQKNLLYIIIPSFILIIIWIVADIYNHAVMTTVTSDQAVSIQPISSSFDVGVLDNLRGRKIVTPDSTAEAVPPIVEPAALPTPALDIVPDASESVGETP